MFYSRNTNSKYVHYIKDTKFLNPNLTNLKDDNYYDEGPLENTSSSTGLPTEEQIDNMNTSIQDMVEGLNYNYKHFR